MSAVASRALAAQDLVFPLSEPAFTAQLAGIDWEWNLSFRTAGKVRVLAAAELAYFGRYRDVETGPQIVLADGGIIRGDVLLADANGVVLGDATGLGCGQWDESMLPREAVRAIVWQPPAAVDERDRLLQEVASYRAADDRLILVGGDTVSGAIRALPRSGRFVQDDEDDGKSFQVVGRGASEPLVIPAGKVVASCFGVAERPAEPRGMSAWMGFTDGSLVHAVSLRVRGDDVTLGLACGGELKTTFSGRENEENSFWNAVTYVEPASPRWKWLSDVQHAEYKHLPFVSVERPLGIDQNVLGLRLRCGGAVFRKGLGMPSASRVAYDVGGYRRFAAELAIDERAGLKGSAVFKLLIERPPSGWQTAYESPIIRGGDKPLPISVGLNGATRMALLVEFAERGDECDYANWLQARLIK